MVDSDNMESVTCNDECVDKDAFKAPHQHKSSDIQDLLKEYNNDAQEQRYIYYVFGMINFVDI